MNSACSLGAAPYLTIFLGVAILAVGMVQILRPRWLPGDRLWGELNQSPANAIVGSFVMFSGALWTLVAVVAAIATCQGG